MASPTTTSGFRAAAVRVKARRAAVFALAIVIGLACQTSSPDKGAEPAVERVWPEGPAPTRIRWRAEIRTPQDLGIRPGALRRLWGWISGKDDSPQLVRPSGVSLDSEGRLWVADPGARRIHIFDPEHRKYETLPRKGDPPLKSPITVVHDPRGIAYVSDSAAAVIRRFDRKGRSLPEWDVEGDLIRPTGLAFDASAELLWVVDTGRHQLLALGVDGRIQRIVGERGSGEGQFNFPTHLALAPDGRLLVSDTLNFRLQVLSPTGQPISSIGELGDGPGSLSRPKGVALDADGHIYVVDSLFDNVQIFSDDGRLLLYFGEPGSDPGSFWLPADIHIVDGRTIYVADAYNQRIQVFEYVEE